MGSGELLICTPCFSLLFIQVIARQDFESQILQATLFLQKYKIIMLKHGVLLAHPSEFVSQNEDVLIKHQAYTFFFLCFVLALILSPKAVVCIEKSPILKGKISDLREISLMIFLSLCAVFQPFPWGILVKNGERSVTAFLK